MAAYRNYQYFGGQPVLQKQIHRPYRDFPEVDPTIFNESAIAFKQIMKDASVVLDELASSKDFAYEVMSAAQVSNTSKVDKLIQSTGIKSEVETAYTPDGITLKFKAEVKNTECCKLTMKLRWR